MDPPALTAGQVEQGKLVRGEGRSALRRGPAAGPVQPAPGPLCPWSPARGSRALTQSFMSCSVAAARRTGHLCRVLSGV